MTGEAGGRWSRRTKTKPHLALLVLAVAIGLAVITVLLDRISFTSSDLVYIGLAVGGSIILVLLVTFSWTEVTVELEGDTFAVETRAGILGHARLYERRVPRERMVKIKERGIPGLVETVVVLDREGRTLAAFPRFLDEEEHEAMIAAILEWGNQPSSCEGGSEAEEGAEAPAEAR